MKDLLIMILLLACNHVVHAKGCNSDFPVASMCQSNTVSGPEIVLDVSTAGRTNYRSCECYLSSDEDGIRLIFDSKPNVTNCGNQLDLIFEDVGMQMKCGVPIGEQSTKGSSGTIRYTKNVNTTSVDSGYCLRFYSVGRDTKLVLNCEVSATTTSTLSVSISASTNTQPANNSSSASTKTTLTTTQSSLNFTSVVNTTFNTTRNVISTSASTLKSSTLSPNSSLSTTTSIPPHTSLSPTTLDATTLSSNRTNFTNTTTSSTQNMFTGTSVPPEKSPVTITAISPNTSSVTTRVTFNSSSTAVSSLNESTYHTTSREITSSSRSLNSTTTKISNLTEASDETVDTKVTSTPSPPNNITTSDTDTSSVSNVSITPKASPNMPNSTISNNDSTETTTTNTLINTTTSVSKNATVITKTLTNLTTHMTITNNNTNTNMSTRTTPTSKEAENKTSSQINNTVTKPSTTTAVPGSNTTDPTNKNNVTSTTKVSSNVTNYVTDTPLKSTKEVSSNVTNNMTEAPLTSSTEVSSNVTNNVTEAPLTSSTEVSSNVTNNVTDAPLTRPTEVSSNVTNNVTDAPVTSSTEVSSNVTNNVTDAPLTNATEPLTTNTTESPENYTTSFTTVTDIPSGNQTGNDSAVTTPINSNVTTENNSTEGNQTEEVSPNVTEVTKNPTTSGGFWEPPIPNYPDDSEKPNNIVIILVPIAVVVLLCFVMAVAYVMCKRSKEALRRKSKEDELTRTINKETAAKIGNVKAKPENPVENFVVSNTTNDNAEEKYNKNRAKYEAVNETIKDDNKLSRNGNDVGDTVNKNSLPESKPQPYEPSDRERDLLQSLELSTIVIEQDPDDTNRYFKKKDPGDWYRVIIKGKTPRDPNSTLNTTKKSGRKRGKRKSRGDSHSNTSSSDDTKYRKKSRRSRRHSDLDQTDQSDHKKNRKTKSEENRRHSSIGQLQNSANIHDTVQSMTRSINQTPTKDNHTQEAVHEPVQARVIVSKPVNNVSVPVAIKENNSHAVLMNGSEQTEKVNNGDTRNQSVEQNTMFASGRSRNSVFGSSFKLKNEEATKRPDIVPPLDLKQSAEKSKKNDDFDIEEFDL